MDGTIDRSADDDAAGCVSAAHALTDRLARHTAAERDHWSNAAQQLITGLILYSLHKARRTQTRVTLRGVHDELGAALSAPAQALWSDMAALATAVPAAAAAGKSMLHRSEQERAGIVAAAHTMLKGWLDDGFEPDCERAMHALVLEAHRFAAIAVQRAVTAFLRARLSCRYSLHSEIAGRLMWLIDATDFVLAAIGGASMCNRAATRPQLARIDAEVSPGSLWHFAWRHSDREEQDLALSRGDDSELPKLLATYDAAFAAWLDAVPEPESDTAALS